MSTPPPSGPPHPLGGQQPPPASGFGPPPGPPPQQAWAFPPAAPAVPPVPAMPPLPPGAPPRRGGTGRTLAIAAGVLVLLGVLAVPAQKVLGTLSTSAFPPAEHMLTLPQHLLGGRYTLTDDESAAMKEELTGEDVRRDPTIRDPRPAVGHYSGSGTKDTAVLSFSGMYGQFKHPESVRDSILRGARTSESAAEAGPPKVFRPAGSEVAVSCQVLTLTGAGAKSTVPMCAWGDGNTAAVVGWVLPDVSGRAPDAVDLAGFARLTLDVRAETRRPLTRP
ncbi:MULTISPECIES: hypothetical protein [Streptomyces]|uniref:hypothetical protein n=1 Tax=Streptomyces TaxID=1883 RepID=UPI0016752DBC|nr:MULTISPECIES: hypothetical protein [Streptomyces]MBD3575453.1 hypothetical protein [Streptomyces sp. KD18]GGS93396.1 hypothetical protein GCM10010286_17760 [Streptomyces toxytricini]